MRAPWFAAMLTIVVGITLPSPLFAQGGPVGGVIVGGPTGQNPDVSVRRRVETGSVERRRRQITPEAEISRDGRRVTGRGQRFGSGFEISRDGRRVTGTGRNFGSGFDVSRDGRRQTGTGRNFGSGFETNRAGSRITGTGANFGRGWQRSNNGREWLGTGANFGRRCPITRVPPNIACG
jgi:hypothetical protein